LLAAFQGMILQHRIVDPAELDRVHKGVIGSVRRTPNGHRIAHNDLEATGA